MRNKICPKCGCIFDEEKLKCIDCSELLKQATPEEIYDYEQKARTGLNNASDRSENIKPEMWQCIAAAGLLAYSVVITLIFQLTFYLILLNAIFALAVIAPAFRIYINKDPKRGKKFWYKLYYPQAPYKFAFGGAVILNVFILAMLVFHE